MTPEDSTESVAVAASAPGVRASPVRAERGVPGASARRWGFRHRTKVCGLLTAILVLWLGGPVQSQPLDVSRTDPQLRLGHVSTGVIQEEDGALRSVRVRVPLYLERSDDGPNVIQATVDYNRRYLRFLEARLGQGAVDPARGRIWRFNLADGVAETEAGRVRLRFDLAELTVPLSQVEYYPRQESMPLAELVFSVETHPEYDERFETFAYVAFAPYPPPEDDGEPPPEVPDPSDLSFLAATESAEGGPLERLPTNLVNGGVSIFSGVGLEIGSGRITQREQDFVVPLYLTYPGEPESVAVGVDYDELILLSTVRPIHPPVAAEEIAVQTGEVLVENPGEVGRRTSIFAIRLAEHPTEGGEPAYYARTHVADLVFHFEGVVPPGDGTPLEIRIEPRFLGVGAGGGAGDPPSDDPVAHSRAGVIQLLDPYFVRGNVDSHVEPGTTRTVTIEGTRVELPGAEPDIIDAVTILRYLFAGGSTEVPCIEAADVDNDGEIGLPDGMELLVYFFQSGDWPAPPFPLPGRDPDLPEEQPGEPGAAGVSVFLGCDQPLPIFVPLRSRPEE